ncbi:tail completion or Neck1 protein [Mycobacterium phage Severus]|uniref:tail completion or Neck1 protein n=1 Tax=Mycobacterium phage Severus TaxID=1327776 RepID=UPI00032B88D8|nr:tail completion or Neck1 protein [Mycobacterium phage Severus]AGK87951.1 hypothetical protein PBI_SEVERUS_19 [Mycobacterium phage Severus]AVO22420.1 hypothetical protein SEA_KITTENMITTENS_19 [Mycobacterium phage KittenMittens]QWS69303.1 hypothetical protein SEA_PEACEMEAL1_19 [Mycobacterium Phage PeaceMeal1]USL89153.1 hypothetical protein SEA_POOMPHA_19 [Mycobacterium phage Poompha]
MARLIPRKSLNSIVAHLPEVKQAIRRETKECENRADQNLARARASTTHSKIIGPGHLTSIGSYQEEVDGIVHMDAPNPIAIEYGHGPSGYFDPDKYGKVTKAPHGLYILTRAAGIAGAHVTTSMGRRGVK